MNFWELSSTYVPPPAPPPAPAIKQKRGRPRKHKPSDPKKAVAKMVPPDKRAAATEWQLSHPEKMKEFKRAWRHRDAVKALCESNLREKNEQETKDRQTEACTASR